MVDSGIVGRICCCNYKFIRALELNPNGQDGDAQSELFLREKRLRAEVGVSPLRVDRVVERGVEVRAVAGDVAVFERGVEPVV